MATIDRYKLKIETSGENKIKELGNNVVSVIGSLKSAQTQINRFGLAGLVALSTLAGTALRLSKRMTDLSGTVGFTAAEILQMSLAAEQAGGSFDQTERTLLRFANSIESAVDGNDKMRQSLERVGISTQELQTLDDQQLFRRVVSGLANMADGAEKTALTIQLLGRAAATTDLRRFSEGLNQAVDPALERRLQNAAELLDKMRQRFRLLQLAALEAMEPIIERLNSFSFNADDAKKAIQLFGAILAAAFAASVVISITRVIQLFGTLARAITGAATAKAFLISLTGAGLLLVAAAGTAATLAYKQLGEMIDDATEAQEGLNQAVAGQGGTSTDVIRGIQRSGEDERARSVANTTTQLAHQLRINEEYRRGVIQTIGLESERASLIQRNLSAQRDTEIRLLQLASQINDEKSKQRPNQEIIANLQYQLRLTQEQFELNKLLNEQEFERTQAVRLRLVGEELALRSMHLTNQAAQEQHALIKTMGLIQGEINQEELDHQLTIERLRRENQSRRNDLMVQLAIAMEQQNTAEIARIEGLIKLEDERHDVVIRNLKLERQLRKELEQSSIAGAVNAMNQIAQAFTPYQMAQDAILQGWNRIGSAIDSFVETGKFKFKDFARSVLQDLLKMIIRAQVFQAITGAFGGLGIPIPGLAKGGPAKANQPYIVGEKGPELFVPKSAGTVIPNDRLTGSSPSSANTGMSDTIVNNYITNNISAIDSKSVAQLFAENRKTLLGTVQMAQRELP